MIQRNLAMVVCLILAGCASSRNPDDPLAALDIEDPDPEDEAKAPQFCNPTGRTGADLQACHDRNEAFYKQFDEEAKRREPWFNFTPDSWASSQEVDGKLVLPVKREAEAIAKLEAAPFVELSPTEVEFYAGRQAAHGSAKPYLVRGLLYFRDTGSFSVYEKDQAILVHHDSRGPSTPDEKRSAVVVFLDHQPKAVYVDCGVSE